MTWRGDVLVAFGRVWARVATPVIADAGDKDPLATLETALVGTPFTLFYIVSKTSGWVVENLLRYRGFYGMPNLLHGREVIREFIQRDATADNVAEEAIRLVESESYRRTMAERLLQCRELLGRPGASERAAREVQAILKKRQVGHC